MQNIIDKQLAVGDIEQLPSDRQLQQWVDLVLEDYDRNTELVIRIVEEQESAQLNSLYRNKQGPTNILSFPVELPDFIEDDLLGDLVICASVLACEAKEQGKSLHDHWAHIVMHGVLHLLGYDHIDEREAEDMEEKEIALLKTLGIANPYLQVERL